MDLRVGGLGKGHDCRVGLKESPLWREEAQICVKQLLSGRDCRSDSERDYELKREGQGGGNLGHYRPTSLIHMA